MNDNVKFYCENCQKPVSHRAKICPHCGSFFSLVKCPECGRRGPGHEFLHGCPACGYLGDKSGGGKMSPGGAYETVFVIGKNLDDELPPVRRAVRHKPVPPSVGIVLASVGVFGFLATVLAIWLSRG